MKVKDLLPLIQDEWEIYTTYNEGGETCICDNGNDLTKEIEESEIKEISSGDCCTFITVPYDSKFFVKKTDIANYPDTIWIMITEYDNPMAYYFKSDAKKAYGNYIREKYDEEDEILKMSDDEIWDEMDEFDEDYVIEQTIIK